MIFFIHVQKTGGTSLRHAALAALPPDSTVMLYGEDSQWTSPLVKQVYYAEGGTRRERLNRLSRAVEERRPRFFSTHLHPSEFSFFRPEEAVTILRDPVERVLSQYYFYRQKGRTRATLAAFIEQPENINEQARALSGIDLGKLALVGVLEDYEGFIRRMNARFGLELEVVHRKRGGVVKDLRAGLIRPDLRRRIAALNHDDFRVYEQALALARPSAANPGVAEPQLRQG